tara:strand:+ start:1347 stop:2618 length:1272 start_codon:yes stop_codon:yes gene_type:complete
MNLTDKQQAAVDHLYENDASILVAPTGEGKTVIGLTAMSALIADGHHKKFIVACPARVRGVWPADAAKWPHLRHLNVMVLDGDAEARQTGLSTEGVDVLVVSLNSLDWLLHQDHEATGIYIDELSKASGKQSKGLRSKRLADTLTWRVGATATPVAQNYERVYKMLRVLDKGVRLGTNNTHFLEEYFNRNYTATGWDIRPGSAETIMAKIADIIFYIDDTKADTLPPLRELMLRFDMPETTREVYDEMKKEFVVGEVVAVNDAVKSGKMRQIASGFAYRENGGYDRYDTARTNEVRRWIAGLGDRRGVILYEFAVQGDDIEGSGDVEAFKRGEGQVLVAQISSLSHGVEGLQQCASDMLLVQPPWSRDTKEQAIGRLWRQGQPSPVTVTTLVCNDTIDDIALARVAGNAQWMDIFSKHMKGEG